MEQQMIILLAGVGVLGLLIGFLIGKAIGGKNSSSTKKVEKEFQAYKAKVSEHFGKTADLVDNLTNSYKDVFDHLGNSAKVLLTEEEVKKHLQSRAKKAVTLTYLQEQKDTEKVVEVQEKTPKESKPSDETENPADDKPANDKEVTAKEENKTEGKTETAKEKLKADLEKIADKVEETEASKAK